MVLLRMFPSSRPFLPFRQALFSGDSSNLSWSITNANSATIDQEIGNVAASSGTISVHPTETTEYTLKATNTAGNVTSKTTIRVKEIL